MLDTRCRVTYGKNNRYMYSYLHKLIQPPPFLKTKRMNVMIKIGL